MRPHLRHTSRLTVGSDGTQPGQLVLTFQSYQEPTPSRCDLKHTAWSPCSGARSTVSWYVCCGAGVSGTIPLSRRAAGICDTSVSANVEMTKIIGLLIAANIVSTVILWMVLTKERKRTRVLCAFVAGLVSKRKRRRLQNR